MASLGCCCLSLFGALVLNNNEEVVLVGGNHHIVLLATDAEENQIVRSIHIADQVTRLTSQLRKTDAIVTRELLVFRVGGESRFHEVRSVVLITLILHNQQSHNALLAGDALDSLLDFGLVVLSVNLVTYHL